MNEQMNECMNVSPALLVPQELDEAARRRLPKQLYIPLPCAEARRAMILRQLGPGGKVSAALSPAGGWLGGWVPASLRGAGRCSVVAAGPWVW